MIHALLKIKFILFPFFSINIHRLLLTLMNSHEAPGESEYDGDVCNLPTAALGAMTRGKTGGEWTERSHRCQVVPFNARVPQDWHLVISFNTHVPQYWDLYSKTNLHFFMWLSSLNLFLKTLPHSMQDIFLGGKSLASQNMQCQFSGHVKTEWVVLFLQPPRAGQDLGRISTSTHNWAEH